MTRCKFRQVPNQRRRELLLKAGVLGSITLLATTGTRRIQAQDDLPHLSEDDPMAQALKYVHDASEAAEEREPEEFCHNCVYFKGDQSTQWAECQLFPGKAVNADGWCITWVQKP